MSYLRFFGAGCAALFICLALAGCPGLGPYAGFTAQPLSGPAPLTVTFVDRSISVSSLITSWEWDFGDGDSSTEQAPTHTYTTPGTYTVSLTVKAATGGSDTRTMDNYITVTAEGANDVQWISGVTSPASWAIDPPEPTAADVIHFSGPTALYMNTCVATSSVGTPYLAIDAVGRTVKLLFEPRLALPCAAIYMPVCGLEGTFGPLAEGDWVFSSQNPYDALIAFTVPFHVGPPGPPNQVAASWISGETGPAAWTVDVLALDSLRNGIHVSGPTQVFPTACNGEAALGGQPFISIDNNAHALVLVFVGPAPEVCPDLYAPVCGLQAYVMDLANGAWTFSAPTLTPPVNLTFSLGSIPNR